MKSKPVVLNRAKLDKACVLTVNFICGRIQTRTELVLKLAPVLGGREAARGFVATYLAPESQGVAFGKAVKGLVKSGRAVLS